MDKRILEGGIEEVEGIKEQLTELNNCRERENELEVKEKEAQQNLTQKENAVESEIKSVTRQRREELESTFDKQLESVQGKLKKVEANKEKAKKKAMSQRIHEETADLRKEEEELSLAGRAVFKEKNIPLMYNNRWFFALYFPSGLGDIGIVILTLALAFFAVPFGIYNIFFEGMGTLYLGMSYVIAILVFGGLYLIISKTKYKHLDALKRVKEIRKQIRENQKEQRKIKRQIEKDEDENPYDLKEFDREIEEYKKSIQELTEKKKKALQEFDEETAQEIQRQIKETHEEELKALKEAYQRIYDERKDNLEKLNNLSVKVSTEYESILGKEVLTVEKLDKMAETIREGKAENIKEAKEVLNQEN
ncbi:hypothetical protein [Isachenkonia alkalipeptolytica]|uniref:Uncharacterized protein n=1 Tax=Isachenkonia alkalipeptolytica TaxID=2565777 RepID=A0AA43XKU4_9CLOT|nr:hypothetical protein [Isachenkonia alkalipeptolytica]NBG88176.1 hypothetical protein [Isachenkonia alkalipeptolytica]